LRGLLADGSGSQFHYADATLDDRHRAAGVSVMTERDLVQRLVANKTKALAQAAEEKRKADHEAHLERQRKAEIAARKTQALFEQCKHRFVGVQMPTGHKFEVFRHPTIPSLRVDADADGGVQFVVVGAMHNPQNGSWAGAVYFAAARHHDDWYELATTTVKGIRKASTDAELIDMLDKMVEELCDQEVMKAAIDTVRNPEREFGVDFI
jgi:hypothetical protein